LPIKATELIVLLFGFLSSIYKFNFIDPIDKPPSLHKTLARVIDSILSHLKNNSTSVHIACSSALIEIYENCFMKENIEMFNYLIYEPLEKIIFSGADRLAQVASCLVILKFSE